MLDSIDLEACREARAIKERWSMRGDCPYRKTVSKTVERFAVELRTGEVLKGFFVRRGELAVFEDHEKGRRAFRRNDIVSISRV